MLLVCSSGGHLAQLMRLRSWWEGHERTWACFPLPDAEALLADEEVVWVHHPTTRHLGEPRCATSRSRCACSGASGPT